LTVHKQSERCVREGAALPAAESRFCVFPGNFITEAKAFGAELVPTASGFFDVLPLVNRPEALGKLPGLSQTPMIKRLLSDIEAAARTSPVMLYLNGAYTVLTQLCTPRLFAWMIKEPDAVHRALAQLAGALAEVGIAALNRGARVLSAADPGASKELLGERRYRTFAAFYQFRLLKALHDGAAGGVVHTCPYNFMPLIDYGGVTAKRELFERRGYEAVLLELADTEEMVITGGQCPHTAATDYIDKWELKNMDIEGV
jgi:hypothetical protein